LKLAGEGSVFPQAYEYVAQALQKVYQDVTAMREKIILERGIDGTSQGSDEDGMKVLDPPNSSAKGVLEIDSNHIWRIHTLIKKKA